MKLRILYASDIFYPYPGGISEHIHHLALYMRKFGHETYILTTNFDDGVPYKEPDYVIRVGKAIKIPINKSIGSIAFSPRISKLIKDIVQGGNYDIVHTHGPIAPMIPMFALKYSRSLNFATFHSAHDESLLYKLTKNYLEQYYRKLHGKIAVSKVAMKSIAKYFPGEYRIIPNGVDVHRFKPSNQPIDWLRARKERKILFVGRLEPRKGLRYLLLALPEILRYVPDAILVVVGDGPWKGYYEQFVRKEFKDKVIFVGKVPYDELPRYYVSVDVFVSPATGNESFGIVLLEAFASKVPVVASNIEGYMQVVRDGENALVFRAKDHLDLADKVVKLLTNKQLCNKLVENAYREVLNKYSWERVAKQVEEYYMEIYDRYKHSHVQTV